MRVSGDDLFSAPKTSWSLSNSDLRHLQHSSDSNRLQVLETLWSTSYSEPLPVVPNATTCSFHSDPSPNTPSSGCSETSASSKGNLETPLVSALSNPNSTPTLFRDSPSCNGVRATPAALLHNDYQRPTMELLSLLVVMLEGTWLQLMCCTLPKCLCP